MRHLRLVPSVGVAGDTLVQTNQGIRPIYNTFPIQRKDHGINIRQKLNHISFGITPTPSAILQYIGHRPTVRITTVAGKTIEGSLDHRAMTLHPISNKMEYTPLAQVTLGHYLVGMVTNQNVVTPTPFSPGRDIPCEEFLTLHYAEQADRVSSLVLKEKSHTIRATSPLYARSLAATASMMGCYSSIDEVVWPIGARTCYHVNLIPMMENSLLSQLVGCNLCTYSRTTARDYKGEANYIAEYAISDEIKEVIQRVREFNGVLFADRVCSMCTEYSEHTHTDQKGFIEIYNKIPLYSLYVPRYHSFVGDGYIYRSAPRSVAN